MSEKSEGGGSLDPGSLSSNSGCWLIRVALANPFFWGGGGGGGAIQVAVLFASRGEANFRVPR